MFEELERAWTADSAGYDDSIKRQLKNKQDVEHWTQELAAILGEKKKVLDVGCGPGFLTVILSRLGHEVKAIDGSEGMVRCANGNFAAEGCDAAASVEDAVLLPDEADESYDVIISRDVVWTLYDPEQAFRRWKQVLRPGGMVLIYDGNYRRDVDSLKIRAWKGLSNLLLVLTERKLPEKKEHHARDSVFTRLPLVTRQRPQEDMKLLREAGFKKIRVTNDRYRNSPSRLEFWRFGYQGKKFRVIAWKKDGRNKEQQQPGQE